MEVVSVIMYIQGPGFECELLVKNHTYDSVQGPRLRSCIAKIVAGDLGRHSLFPTAQDKPSSRLLFVGIGYCCNVGQKAMQVACCFP